ncbi:hypothetical protein E2C01_016041 [Portunus trituberculatus]|uniref:Uncharacterized protein n=1 Tax=Portunus trituberculatus TaxID=210409 RepID=A0A5B7DNI2_PORTR|nr:hypothetical protein [Portunus trituberculatus]
MEWRWRVRRSPWVCRPNSSRRLAVWRAEDLPAGVPVGEHLFIRYLVLHASLLSRPPPLRLPWPALRDPSDCRDHRVDVNWRAVFASMVIIVIEN